MKLSKKHCVPCEGGQSPMPEVEENRYLHDVNDWDIDREGIHKIKKKFSFKNFKESMEFVNDVAEIAENEGHHPDIYISWNKVKFVLYTHAIEGLSENDFIMASKIDDLYGEDFS
ncbi:MAG: 4a-hydroxytetrahydrobiopterin dehydratase [Candidatus Saliniplasma sp.]